MRPPDTAKISSEHVNNDSFQRAARGSESQAATVTSRSVTLTAANIALVNARVIEMTNERGETVNFSEALRSFLK